MGRKFSHGVGIHLTLVVGLLVAMSTWPGAAAAQRDEPSVKQQLEFGVDMARRGLWSEALFRFRQAERLAPEKPEVYNNLAVAHEALGLFEEALELYRKGLSLAPRDKGLRNNYARFIDFYNRFRPDAEDAEADKAEADLDRAPPSASATTTTDAGPPPKTPRLSLVKPESSQLGVSQSTAPSSWIAQREAVSMPYAETDVDQLLASRVTCWVKSSARNMQSLSQG